MIKCTRCTILGVWDAHDFGMPTIVKIGVFKVQVFPDDHYPRHFHIVGPDFEVVVAMSDVSILHGRRHLREVRGVLDWAEQNMGLLEREWDRLNDL